MKPPLLCWPSKRSVGLAATYELAAVTAAQEGDEDSAMLYLQRAEQLSPMSRSVQFALAELLLARGQSELAIYRLERLAPRDSQGHWPAHLKLARLISAGRERWTAEQVTVVLHHLRAVIDRQPDCFVARQMIADVLVGTKRFKEAVPHLLVVSEASPRHRITLARTYRALGQETNALRELREVNKLFHANAPQDDRDFVLAAQAYALQNDFKRARRILYDRYQSAPSSAIKTAFVGTLAAHAEYLRMHGADVASRLQLLEEALAIDPNSPAVLIGIATFVYLDGDEATRARDLLEESLADGRAPAAVHLILGTRALLDEDVAAARTHLEAAHAINANLPDVLNNLAVVEWKSSHGDYERGLRLVNQALAWAPNNANYRETRAQLLVVQGRTDEAIADLEASLGGTPNERAVRKTLADIYAAKGMTSLANKHRARLQAGARAIQR